MIVFDASSIVGAALKRDSTPERALLWAEDNEVFALSAAVDAEIANVLDRPKFAGAIPWRSDAGSWPSFAPDQRGIGSSHREGDAGYSSHNIYVGNLDWESPIAQPGKLSHDTLPKGS